MFSMQFNARLDASHQGLPLCTLLEIMMHPSSSVPYTLSTSVLYYGKSWWEQNICSLSVKWRWGLLPDVQFSCFLQETVVAEKESDPHQNHLNVHENRTLFNALDTLRHMTKAYMLWCQRARSCNSMSDKDADRSVSSPLHDLPHQPLRGLPRCILQAKGGHTEMGQLLTESELQLQDVRDMYRIKKAAVLQQLHQLARQTENVVLFPRLLKWLIMACIFSQQLLMILALLLCAFCW